MSEMFPTRMRYSGVSLGYQVTSIVAGSLAPIIATALLGAYGSSVPVAMYLMAACTSPLSWCSRSRRPRASRCTTSTKRMRRARRISSPPPRRRTEAPTAPRHRPLGSARIPAAECFASEALRAPQKGFDTCRELSVGRDTDAACANRLVERSHGTIHGRLCRPQRCCRLRAPTGEKGRQFAVEPLVRHCRGDRPIAPASAAVSKRPPYSSSFARDGPIRTTSRWTNGTGTRMPSFGNRHADPGRCGHQLQVASQRQLAAAAGRYAFDDGDRRNGDVLDRLQRALDLGEAFAHLIRREAGPLPQVRAGTGIVPALPADDDRAHRAGHLQRERAASASLRHSSRSMALSRAPEPTVRVATVLDSSKLSASDSGAPRSLDRARGVHGGDGVVVEAQLGQYFVRVLPQQRRRASSPAAGVLVRWIGQLTRFNVPAVGCCTSATMPRRAPAGPPAPRRRSGSARPARRPNSAPQPSPASCALS